MFDDSLTKRAADLLDCCRTKGVQLATAESCTGGLIAGCLTEIAGSSDVVDRGFVTYSNAAKQELLAVPESLLAEHGAVSEPVARAMAEGALAHSQADLTVAVTGIAGPGGGSAEKPVGLVYIATAQKGGTTACHRHVFPGDRADVRRQTVEAALKQLEERLRD